MGGKKYSLAGGALSAKMKAGGSKCGIGDALTRELHLPSQWMESGIMPVWQTVRLLREASLNKHQQILKHFVPRISFFLMGIVKSFVILRLHLILRILGLAMRRGRKLARDFLSRLLSSSGSLPFLSCREVAGPSFSDDSRCRWTRLGSAARLDRRPARETPVHEQPTSSTSSLHSAKFWRKPQKSLGSPVFLVKYCTVLATSAKTFDLKLGVHYT